MVINMTIGLAVQNNNAAIGVIVLFFLFAFWAGKYVFAVDPSSKLPKCGTR